MRCLACFTLFAGLLGFALGGSFVWGIQEPAHKEIRTSGGQGVQQQVKQQQGWHWGHSDPGVTIATVVLVIVGAIQAGMFFVQLRYMNTGMHDATVAARAARRSAVAAVAQAQIAKRALTDLEAPFIGLHIIDTGLKCGWEKYEDYIIDETSDGLRYCFANYGRTAAVLLSLKDKLEVCPSGQMPKLEWDPERDKPYPYGVFVGPDKKSAESSRKWKDYADENTWFLFRGCGADLFLVGRLRYRDIFNSVFEMGFCAVYNHETGGFLMKGGDEYNYNRKVS